MNHQTRSRLRVAALTMIVMTATMMFSLFSQSAMARAKKSSKAATTAQKNKKGREKSSAAKTSSKTSSKNRRERASTTRAGRGRKGGGVRQLSRRERLALARRLAEARRRAELARLAAIARQRAADQALRDETAANIGRDVTTGEDMEIRRAAIQSLGNHAGTVVVLDPKTGRVYSIVNQEWAVRRGFVPCSTIKLVTGLAGLSEKVIDPLETVPVSAGRAYPLDLTDSLAYSNNGYFQNVGGRVGFDKMVYYARMLGLGERTGINHPNEYAGRVPLFKSGYAVNHMCSHGDDFEVTPIQLGVIAAAIANGGSLLTPHLPRTPDENTRFKTEVRRHLDIAPENLQRMLPGMIGAVNFGTAKLAYDMSQTIAGKTGTCTGQGAKLGLFTSFAPVGDPRLAVVVVTRGSGERGKIAAGVAGGVYRALSYRFVKQGSGQIAVTPHAKLDAAAAAAVSDEDKDADEAEATDANAAGTPASTTINSATRGTAKTVLMPVEVRPTEVITKPATTDPAAAAAGGTPTPQGKERPRRVLVNRP